MSAKNDWGCVMCNISTGKCAGYTLDSCAGCRFALYPSQERASKIRAAKRLNSLPFRQQMDIANKYYNGEMPWKELVSNGIA